MSNNIGNIGITREEVSNLIALLKQEQKNLISPTPNKTPEKTKTKK